MRTTTIVGALAILATSSVAAQDPLRAASAFSLRGVVVDGYGEPLLGAEIYTEAGERAISNASGEFLLSNLTDRSLNLFVRRIGYGPVSFGINVDATVTSVSIRARLLPVAVAIGTVVVEGRVLDKDLWDKGFYKRMNGATTGTFFTPERLANSSVNVSTLISEVPRLRIAQGRGGVAIPKAPYKGGSDYCTLSAVIDGVAFSSSFVDQVGIDNLVNISEVKGIEVYLKAGRIPNMTVGRSGTQSIANGMNSSVGAEAGSQGVAFGGSDGVECGTIIVWTRGGH
ncbi:MAG TPA: carboxypeptidase regulatory-like domain-containing protein [Gemmatimonadaceae bacterium]|jgi:hypothetical protein|nr:carboxypeptidase regulatory-like domain-containing protein [Gemmatimonadaceae bacterium]